MVGADGDDLANMVDKDRSRMSLVQSGLDTFMTARSAEFAKTLEGKSPEEVEELRAEMKGTFLQAPLLSRQRRQDEASRVAHVILLP